MGLGQRLAQTPARQDEVVIDLKQHQLIPKARFALAEGVLPGRPTAATPLANIEVEPLHKIGRCRWSSHMLACTCAMARRVPNATWCVTPTMALLLVRLNDLRVEQFGQWHPPRLGHRTFVLATLALHPMAKMGQYCRPILFKPVGQEQGARSPEPTPERVGARRVGPSPGCECRHRQPPAACS